MRHIQIFEDFNSDEPKKFDYSKITDVEMEDVDPSDYPDFSDAYIIYANYEGRPMTEEELEDLNNDSEFVYDHAMAHYIGLGDDYYDRQKGH